MQTLWDPHLRERSGLEFSKAPRPELVPKRSRSWLATAR